jgi:beta-glucosidase
VLSRLSRRELAKVMGSAALGVSVPSARSADAAIAPGSTFPAGFLWGVATSAYQVEGAVAEDGRGPSIWDRYTHTKGTIADNSNGDVAVDHYHRYRDDVQLMKALGVKAYRFSIAWPRIFPEGSGAPNPKGLDFYQRLVDELVANGIEPFATLYHWDLPERLQQRLGGWRSRDTAQAFADYAGYVAERLTDRVKHLFTINECSRLVHLGHGLGIDAPGLRLAPQELNQVRHHVALGHGLSVQAIRARARPGTRLGPAENMVVCIPVIETPENIRAAEIATRELNAGYLTAMLEGAYRESFLAQAGQDAPRFAADDLKIISSPIDFIGLNIYKADHYVMAADNASGFASLRFPASFPHMESSWLNIAPEAMYWAPRHAARLWGVKSIYISENGTSATDAPTASGETYDLDRIMYLRNYLLHLQRATSEGLPVTGYFLWTLMDNFEWADGYEKRFGLYRVDFETLVRWPKLSASFYRETIRRNAVA